MGDYVIDKVDLHRKMPRCTIGSSKRFEQLSSIQRYKLVVPVAYRSNVGRDSSAPRKKLGVFGSEPRFGEGDRTLPGPGQYNT